MNLERFRIWSGEKERVPHEIKVLLKDIQNTMGIPWVPATWRSYGAYPRIAELFWERLKPAVATESFLQDSLDITEFAYREASRWYRPGYTPDLPEDDLEQLRWELDAFEFGNPQILIQQVVLARAMRGQIAGGERSTQARQHSSSYRRPEIQLVDEAQAPEEVKLLFEDIRETLGLPLINSDYRALAKWPTFLKAAWEDAKPWRIGHHEYSGLHQELIRKAERAAEGVCPPVHLDARELLAAVASPEELETVREMVDRFTEMMPGLLVSDALFRIGAARGQYVEPLLPQGVAAPRRKGLLSSLGLASARGGSAAFGAGLLGVVVGAGIIWLLDRRRRQ